jgi:hypothetical protein
MFLHHVIGMPEAYARYVDGFVMGPQSVALAAFTGQLIITRDVAEAHDGNRGHVACQNSLIIVLVVLFPLRLPEDFCDALQGAARSNSTRP